MRLFAFLVFKLDAEFFHSEHIEFSMIIQVILSGLQTHD